MNGIPQDGPERWRYAASVALYAAAGDRIEYSPRGLRQWEWSKEPTFDWYRNDYRVAPKAPRVCKAEYLKNLEDAEDPWQYSYPIESDQDASEGAEMISLIELTAEVRAALAAAGIDYEGKEAV